MNKCYKVEATSYLRRTMPQPRKKTREYIDVNLPRRLEPYLQELLTSKEIQAELELANLSSTPSGIGNWIIRKYLIDKTSYRFEHINVKDNHITIKDRKLSRIVDVWIKEKNALWCELDNRTDCDHVHAALQVPEVKTVLQQKGWDLPDT